jgi:hypothetical protein
MIRWLVDKHRQEGGTPFDLGRLPAGASRSGPSLATSRAASLASSSRSKTSSLPLMLVWIVILVAIGAVAAFWWQNRASESSARSHRARETSASSTRPLEGSEDSVATESAQLESPLMESDPADAWSAAWENRRVDDLLALYAEEFTPPDGLSREAWETQVRERLNEPGFILVAVSGLDVSFPQIDRATATFYRSIRSDSNNETGRLALDLIARDGGWLIVGQRNVE